MYHLKFEVQGLGIAGFLDILKELKGTLIDPLKEPL